MLEKVAELARGAGTGETGFDALAVVVVRCRDDGSAVELVEGPPAPGAGDLLRYERMIERMASAYATRFARL